MKTMLEMIVKETHCVSVPGGTDPKVRNDTIAAEAAAKKLKPEAKNKTEPKKPAG